MITDIQQITSRISELQPATSHGTVQQILGMRLVVTGLDKEIGIGARCVVKGAMREIFGEVVGAAPEGLVILPFGTWDTIKVGDPVSTLEGGETLRPHESWKGRVLNALGEPLDGQGPLVKGSEPYMVRATPLNAFMRKRVGRKMETSIKTFDVFTPICQGQRMGIFAGSGVGKSSMMSMITRNIDADVIVIGLVGERGREVQDFIQEDLGEEGMKKAVLVVSTGDEPPLMRRQAAWTATTIAEKFRDEGKSVVLLLDSVTRFAMAQREIGLSAGEPPTTKGYPPTVFSELPRLLERAGPGPNGAGDITAIYTVLVDGDDHNEPISDTVRGITDGHIILDRKIAESGRYPAIDILGSVSRMLPDCHSEFEYRVMKEARKLLGKYQDMEELIRIGAYKKGSDKQTDASILFADKAQEFLSQRKHETMRAEESFLELYQMLADSGIAIPLDAEESQEPG